MQLTHSDYLFLQQSLSEPIACYGLFLLKIEHFQQKRHNLWLWDAENHPKCGLLKPRRQVSEIQKWVVSTFFWGGVHHKNEW